MTRCILSIGGALCALSAPAPALGVGISFVGPFDDTGTGFGNVLNVLSLQNTPSEWGSVLRAGGVDVLAGDATNQSSTRTVAEMAAANVFASNLGVVFNINDPGVSPSVTLQTFTMRFYDSSDNVLFDGTWTGPMVLAPVNQGTGGAGYRFDVTLTAAQAAAFFGDPGARIGMLVPQGSPVTMTADGPDNFYLIPAPGTLALLVAGLALAARRRR